MKLNHIYAIIIRFIFLLRHSLDRVTDYFYWPTMDLILWGLTSTYFKSFLPGAPQIVLMILSGILLWILVWRGQYEVSVNLLEEIWNKNLINMFVAPLKFSEWVLSLILLGIIKGLLSLSFATVVAFILYKVQIFYLGFYLLPFIFLLLMTGWSVGFLVNGLIMRFGTQVGNFAWTFIALVSPFSAVFYPLSALPNWAQKISAFVPTSYVFEGMREVINKGHLDPRKLLISFLLNLAYLILSLIFLRKSFDKVLEKGLVKIY